MRGPHDRAGFPVRFGWEPEGDRDVSATVHVLGKKAFAAATLAT